MTEDGEGPGEHKGWTRLLTWRFQGSNFEDHGLDLRDLQTLGSIYKLIQHMTAAAWKADHPEEKLPPNFSESIEVRAFEIRPGSAAIDLYVRQGATAALPEVPRYTERGALKLVETLRSIESKDQPKEVPTRELKDVRKLTSSMRKGDVVAIEVASDLVADAPRPLEFSATLSSKAKREIDARKAESKTTQKRPEKQGVSGRVYAADTPGLWTRMVDSEGNHITVTLKEHQFAAATYAHDNGATHRLYVLGITTFDEQGRPARIGDVSNAVTLRAELLERWASPCEGMFVHLAEDFPDELARMIAEGGLRPPDLTFALEYLGRTASEQFIPVLLKSLEHESAMVREGAIYGLSRWTETAEVRRRLTTLASEDPSAAVRRIATMVVSDE